MKAWTQKTHWSRQTYMNSSNFGCTWEGRLLHWLFVFEEEKLTRRTGYSCSANRTDPPWCSKRELKWWGCHPGTFVVWQTIGTRRGLKRKEIPKSKGDWVRRVSHCSLASRNPCSACPPLAVSCRPELTPEITTGNCINKLLPGPLVLASYWLTPTS